MKTLTAALSLAALATGTAGAAIAYVSTAPGSTAEPTISSPASTPEAAVVTRPGVQLKVRFRKCRAGAQLEHGKCVRHVVRTVFESTPASSATSMSSQSTGGSRDRSRDDHGDRGDGPPKVRQDAGEHPDDESDHESDHESGHESEGSEDHAPDDAAETDD